MLNLGMSLGSGATAWVGSHKWELAGFAVALLAGLFLLARQLDRAAQRA